MIRVNILNMLFFFFFFYIKKYNNTPQCLEEIELNLDTTIHLYLKALDILEFLVDKTKKKWYDFRPALDLAQKLAYG